MNILQWIGFVGSIIGLSCLGVAFLRKKIKN